ncbi:MAG: hypothetical protein CMJ39_09870 [Phycisphaerae bacterium]|nr:hypothetical protein [Phycisphaerae bacterium]
MAGVHAPESISADRMVQLPRVSGSGQFLFQQALPAGNIYWISALQIDTKGVGEDWRLILRSHRSQCKHRLRELLGE